MTDQLPPGAIPLDEETQSNLISGLPPGAVPLDEVQTDQEKYGTGVEQAKTALEQFLSGATLGVSKVIETQALGVSPAAIAGREAGNPGTALTAGLAGGAGLGLLTGGLGIIPEAAGIATKLGAGAAEGALYGGVNELTDEWSQNKPLDAQKIAASTGLGALIGSVGTGTVEGFKSKFSPLAKASSAVVNDAENAALKAAESNEAPIKPPELKSGIQPTSLEDMQKAVETARFNGDAEPLPTKAALLDAAEVPSQYPISPAQLESVDNQAKADLYGIARNDPESEAGKIIIPYEQAQKQESLRQLDQGIQAIAPGYEPTTNAVEAGDRVTQSLTETLEKNRQELGQAIGELKGTELDNVDHLPGVIDYLTEANPKLANMLDTQGEGLAFKPFDEQMGISRKTYQNVRSALKSIENNNPDIEGLFNIRKSLEDGVNIFEKGGAGSEITNARKAMMNYIQDAIQSVNPDAEVRNTFANYAKNEEAINLVEKKFGATIGDNNWRSEVRGGKPEENILDKMFRDSSTTSALRDILPPDKFNQAAADWLAIGKQSAYDPLKGTFSSAKYGNWLNRNQYAMQEAISPETQLYLKRVATKMRLLPDAPSINPSGTAKTLLSGLKKLDLHGLSWEQILASIPKHIAEKYQEREEFRQLNAQLAGKALKSAQESALQKSVDKVSKDMYRKVKALFIGAAGMARKLH